LMGRRTIVTAVSAVVAFTALLLLVLMARSLPGQGPLGGQEAALSSRPSATSAPMLTDEERRYADERMGMVRSQIQARGIHDQEVLLAMENVPRHEFVPKDYVSQAYDDHPLPIGYGQTISQPYIVALMTELLELEKDDKVLEIGTGSGYQAAILAQITDQVISLEIIPELASAARERLHRLGYESVEVHNADGYYGWEEGGPYDAIIVTAAPDHVPQPLLDQLKEGGRMVIPVGPVGLFQTLWLVTKEGGEYQFHNKGGVTFVPLTGEH
jgi:protein-L-isoaspartate(D-aspartate) O-methyltransferase